MANKKDKKLSIIPMKETIVLNNDLEPERMTQEENQESKSPSGTFADRSRSAEQEGVTSAASHFTKTVVPLFNEEELKLYNSFKDPELMVPGSCRCIVESLNVPLTPDTEGGIASKVETPGLTIAVVHAIADDAIKLKAMKLQKGDHVICATNVGNKIQTRGKTYWFLYELDVIGVIGNRK